MRNMKRIDLKQEKDNLEHLKRNRKVGNELSALDDPYIAIRSARCGLALERHKRSMQRWI